MNKAVEQTLILLAMLRNDLRMVVEMRCLEHGRPGDGPNFTACLLALVASEAVGSLVSKTGANQGTAAREFLLEAGTLAKDPNYAKCAGALVQFFRNGIAHSFLPKAYVFPSKKASVQSGCVWIEGEKGTTICIDDLQSPKGRRTVRSWRQKYHLQIERDTPRQPVVKRVFKVSPQILCLDVDNLLAEIESALARGEPGIVDCVAANYPRWRAEASAIRGKLSTTDVGYLMKGR
jgi:hypothetical protein